MDDIFELNPFFYHDFYDPTLEAVAFFVLGLFIFILLIIAILSIIGRWMLFTKANQAGWKAIVPVYKNWVYTVDICKCHWGVFLCEEIVIWTFIPTLFIFRGLTGIILLVVRMIKN